MKKDKLQGQGEHADRLYCGTRKDKPRHGKRRPLDNRGQAQVVCGSPVKDSDELLIAVNLANQDGLVR